MTERVTLDVAREGVRCGTITFDICKDGDEIVLTVRDGSAKGSRVVAADYFAALAVLRQELAKEGLMPVCFGACLYVYPSGMSRDMALGRSAYFLERRRQATREDLVDIFDPLPADILIETLVSDEQAQAEFRMKLVAG